MWSSRIQAWLFVVGMACCSLSAGAAELTISAAASLTNAFKEIAQTYEAQHAETRVQLNFGASGALLQQMAKGAPVDVFASADQETMDQAQKQALVTAKDRQDFARNQLVLIVPTDSKLTLGKLGDLAQSDVQRVAVGNPASVPVGRYSKHALAAAKLWPMVEAKMVGAQNVRQALDYVARGEVDAGFKVRIAFEVPLDITINYPIATTVDSTNSVEARSFVAFILSPTGQNILGKYGFLKH